MIKSIRNGIARDIWTKGAKRNLNNPFIRSAYRKLLMLNSVTTLQDLAACNANNLKKRKGVHDTWSIRVNDQYRICFTWKQGDVYDVDLGDFHT